MSVSPFGLCWPRKGQLVVNVVAVIAFLIGIAGLYDASQATFGAALVGFACLLAILARIHQADAHHEAATIAAVRPPIARTWSRRA